MHASPAPSLTGALLQCFGSGVEIALEVPNEAKQVGVQEVG